MTETVTSPAVTPPPPELGRRGLWLWQESVDDGGAPWSARERILLEEACRTADRLDRLDAQLRGDEDAWLRFRVAEDGAEVTILISNLLSETRQQQGALKQLLGELRVSRAAGLGRIGGRPAAAAAPTTSGGTGVAGVADLTSRIAERQRAQPTR